MQRHFKDYLYEWPKQYIRDQDLFPLFLGEKEKRYDTVKYALRQGTLIWLRRGLYLIKKPAQKTQVEPFEIAQALYSPSYVSLESALSFHGWIPEAVYATTSVCAKRTKTIETSIGIFKYVHIPEAHFFLNVQRIESSESTFLMAEPWKAIGDVIYCYRKKWQSVQDLSADYRIEIETLEESDLSSLHHIAEYYPSNRVQNILRKFLQELS